MTKEERIYNGVKIFSSINGFGKTEKTHAKNKTGALFYTIYNKLKIQT